jgi:hypothetical protein
MTSAFEAANTPAAGVTPTPAPPAPPVVAPPVAPTVPGAAPAPTAAYLAEVGHDIGEGEQLQRSEGPAPEPPAEPAPDIDALARQVYDVLKHRLAAERRRIG